MMPSRREGREEDSRDPVVEEAFSILVRHTQAPRGFHARVMARIAAESQTLRDRVVRWLSPLWHPPLAGELGLNTATGTASETHMFYLAAGEIQVTCEWREAVADQPAILRVAWQASLTGPGDLWVQVMQRDDPSVPPTDLELSALEGQHVWSADALQFDPSRVPWALRIVVTGPEA